MQTSTICPVGPKRWIALGVALASLLALAGSALSNPGSGPVATIACKPIKPGVCSEKGDITLPAHGAGGQVTDTVPGTATQGRLFVAPLNAHDLAVFDGVWEDVVNAYPRISGITSTPLRRALTCVVMARSVTELAKAQRLQTTGSLQADRSVYALFLQTCIQMTVFAQQAVGSGAASTASAGCSMASVSVPILISHTSAGYVIRFDGETSKAIGRGPLAVSCSVKGNGMQINMRSRSKRRKLRQVVGPHLQIGYANSTNRPLTIKTTFTLAR